MAWPTAQTVVAQAGVELGLLSASDLGTDAYASNNPIVMQLLALLKRSGRDLVSEFDWQQLRAEWSITTPAVASLGAFTMPPDWSAMIDQSGWNRTTRLPMGGPLSEQEWQYLSSRLTGVVWTVLFRPMQGLLWLYPPTGTAASQAITFGYKSKNWVSSATFVVGEDYAAWAAGADYSRVGVVTVAQARQAIDVHVFRLVQPGTSGAISPFFDASGVPIVSGSILDGTCYWNWIGVVTQTMDASGVDTQTTLSFGTQDAPEAGDDVLLFDEELLVAKLKLAWLEEKGFDATVAMREYKRQLAQATSNNKGAPMLSLNGAGVVRDRLLGGLNVPITGFGS